MKEENQNGSNVKKEPKLMRWLTSILLLIVGALASHYLPKYLEKERIEINVKHMLINSTEPYYHLYVFELINDGRSFIDNAHLCINRKGKVFSSTFNGSVTLNNSIISKEDLIGFDEDHVEVKHERDTSSVRITKIDSVVKITSESQLDNISSNNSITLTKQTGLYDIANGTFFLASNDSAFASLYCDFELSSVDIICFNDDNKFDEIEMQEEDPVFFKTALMSMSTATDVSTNKIFVESYGIGASHIFEESKIIARNIAVDNLYVDVVSKLFGIKINSSSEHNEKVYNYGDSSTSLYSFESKCNITAEGVIDKSRLKIYDQIFYESGEEVTCELKAFYEIPFELEYSNPIVDFEYLFIDLFPPIKNGGEPYWTLRSPFHKDYFFAIGSAQSNVNKSTILDRKIAYQEAVENIASSIQMKILSVTEDYTNRNVDSLGNNDIYRQIESMSKAVVDQNLRNIQTIEYYVDKNNVTYVLLALSKEKMKQEIFNDDKFFVEWKKQKFREVFEESLKEDD